MVAQKASSMTNAGCGQKVSEDWTRFGKKQILSIGKKRQQIHDEDEADGVAVGYYDSSSDGEEGRTSAVKEKKRNVRLHSVPILVGAVADDVVESAPPKKKTKKKGKKERAKESTERVKPPVTADVPKAMKENDNTGENNDNTQQNEGPKKHNPNTKRKRTKVRSRQKNIRKDNRPANDKPSHLVPGRSEYTGRPMTKETRKKLGIFKEETSVNAASTTDIAFDSGEWVGGDETKFNEVVDLDVNGREGDSKGDDKNTKKSKPEDAGEALTKIGDCIVDCNAAKSDDVKKQDVEEGVVAEYEEKKKKKKKKKQKRKFKNLVVG